MTYDDGADSSFALWLCQSLDAEAFQDVRTGGHLPDRPVRLSEVEALALLVLAIDTGMRSTYLTGAALRLARNLYIRLDDRRPNTPPPSKQG